MSGGSKNQKTLAPPHGICIGMPVLDKDASAGRVMGFSYGIRKGIKKKKKKKIKKRKGKSSDPTSYEQQTG